MHTNICEQRTQIWGKILCKYKRPNFARRFCTNAGEQRTWKYKRCVCVQTDEKEWHAYKYDTVTYWGRDEWSQMKSNHMELKMFKLDLQKDGMRFEHNHFFSGMFCDMKFKIFLWSVSISDTLGATWDRFLHPDLSQAVLRPAPAAIIYLYVECKSSQTFFYTILLLPEPTSEDIIISRSGPCEYPRVLATQFLKLLFVP